MDTDLPDSIRCTTELVQRRETGSMDQQTHNTALGPSQKEFDIFVGDTTGNLPLARIESHAASDNPDPKRGRIQRMFKRSKEYLRKSIIPEAE